MDQPHEVGAVSFASPSVGILANGPRFAPVVAPDTFLFGASPADTFSLSIGTGGGTWIGDSGRLVVRQVLDTFLLADFDLWFSTESNPPQESLHLIGSVVAGGTGNDTVT